MPTPQKVQTRANHVRFDPLFHFVIVPLLLAFLVMSLMHVSHVWNIQTISLALLSIALLLLALRARMYSLKVQDRVIRLEEQLRMATLLPELLRLRISELTVAQYVALRFASDAELASLVKQSLDEHLRNKQIKERITNWRPDYHRV